MQPHSGANNPSGSLVKVSTVWVRDISPSLFRYSDLPFELKFTALTKLLESISSVIFAATDASQPYRDGAVV